MKKEIKIMVLKKGVYTLEKEKAENYDEFTYYEELCTGDKIRSYDLILGWQYVMVKIKKNY